MFFYHNGVLHSSDKSGANIMSHSRSLLLVPFDKPYMISY